MIGLQVAANARDRGWIHTFTSANWTIFTDMVRREYSEDSIRLSASIADAPTWLGFDTYGATDAQYYHYSTSDPTDTYGGVFTRCDGKVYFAYTKIVSRSGASWNIAIRVAWTVENDTVPASWSSWTDEGTVITYNDDVPSGSEGGEYEYMSGSYWWQVSGGSRVSLTCLADQTIVLGSVQLATYSPTDTAGWVAWKLSGSNQWEYPSNPVLGTVEIGPEPLRFDAMGPWIVTMQFSSTTAHFAYAHSSNLSVWSQKSLDIPAATASTGCTGSYRLYGGACNGTNCFYSLSCDDSSVSGNCGLSYIRLLSLTASSCGINGFSQAGDHCIPGEVDNCESTCKCSAGYFYSHTSAFGGCSLPPPPIAAPVAVSPITAPVAASPVTAPVAVSPVASPTVLSQPVVASPVQAQAPFSSPQSSPSQAPVAQTPLAAVPVAAPSVVFVWRFNITSPVPTPQQLSAVEPAIAQVLAVSNVSLVLVSSKRSIQAIVVLDLLVPDQTTLNFILASNSVQQQIRTLVSSSLNAVVPLGPPLTGGAAAPTSDSISGAGIGTGGIIGIVIAAVVLAAIVVVAIIFLMKRNQKKGDQPAKTAASVAEPQPSKPAKKTIKDPKTESSSAPSSSEESSALEKKKKEKKMKQKEPESSAESSERPQTVYGSITDSPAEKSDTKEFRDEWIIAKEDLEVGPKIGKGSFGTVFAGSYGGSKVAIKQCSLSLEKEALEEFKRESIFMLNLKKHPAIVSVLGT
jgi:hypothetical protein